MSDPLKSSFEREMLSRLHRYCSYQERCRKEVSTKLREWGMEDEDEIDDLIVKIMDLGFVDDARFCKLFAVGRFRLKRWGRIKIRYALLKKGLSDQDISHGMDAIEEAEYLETVRHLIHQKNRSVKASDIYQRRHKISNFLIGKGFEPDIVWHILGKEIS